MSAETETTSLDDFFAKKDKKKTKKMKNVLGTDNISANQSQAPADQKKKKQKDKARSATPSRSASLEEGGAKENQKTTEDWNEIVEEGDKDYTGLKIQEMRLGEGGHGEEKGEEATEEDGTGSGSGERSGPWKKMAVVPVPEAETADTTEVVMETNDVPSTGPSKYVPPSVRAAQRQQQQQQQSSQRQRNPKAAPDVKSEEMFPTLGGPRPSKGAAPSIAANPKSFTSLQLQNKWESLSRGAAES